MNQSDIKDMSNQLKQIKGLSIKVKNINGFLDENQIPKGTEVLNIDCSILFVDIRHSTDMTDENGRKNMVKIYKMFAKLIIRAIEENYGHVNQIMGDGMLCMFVTDENGNSGEKAVNAAISINTYLQESYNPLVEDSWKIQCGVGIRTGHVYITKIGIKGANKSCQVAYPSSITNYACKLCSIADGSEILFDNVTYQQIKNKNVTGKATSVSIKNLGNCKSIKDTVWRIVK